MIFMCYPFARMWIDRVRGKKPLCDQSLYASGAETQSENLDWDFLFLQLQSARGSTAGHAQRCLELSFEAIDIQKRDQSLCSLSEGKDGDPLAEVISPAC